MNEQILLDPTSERSPRTRRRAARPPSLDRAVIGLLDISKPRGDVFLDHLAGLLAGRGLRTARFRKPTYTKVAPADLRRRIRETCDVVIEGLAD